LFQMFRKIREDVWPDILAPIMKADGVFVVDVGTVPGLTMPADKVGVVLGSVHDYPFTRW